MTLRDRSALLLWTVAGLAWVLLGAGACIASRTGLHRIPHDPWPVPTIALLAMPVALLGLWLLVRVLRQPGLIRIDIGLDGTLRLTEYGLRGRRQEVLESGDIIAVTVLDGVGPPGRFDLTGPYCAAWLLLRDGRAFRIAEGIREQMVRDRAQAVRERLGLAA
jgi:hypothetical protein